MLSSRSWVEPQRLRRDSGGRRVFAHGARQGAAAVASADSGAFGTGTFLSAAIQLFDPFVDIVLVVAGKNQEDLAPDRVREWRVAGGKSRSSSAGSSVRLQAGLHEVLNRGRDAAMITLVDRPPVSPATIQTLSDAFDGALHGSKWAVVPEYQGKHGHPIFVGREMMEAFLRAPATSSARDVEHAHPEKISLCFRGRSARRHECRYTGTIRRVVCSTLPAS